MSQETLSAEEISISSSNIGSIRWLFGDDATYMQSLLLLEQYGTFCNKLILKFEKSGTTLYNTNDLVLLFHDITSVMNTQKTSHTLISAFLWRVRVALSKLGGDKEIYLNLFSCLTRFYQQYPWETFSGRVVAESIRTVMLNSFII